jgi:hypothetical protein
MVTNNSIKSFRVIKKKKTLIFKRASKPLFQVFIFFDLLQTFSHVFPKKNSFPFLKHFKPAHVIDHGNIISIIVVQFFFFFCSLVYFLNVLLTGGEPPLNSPFNSKLFSSNPISEWVLVNIITLVTIANQDGP